MTNGLRILHSCGRNIMVRILVLDVDILVDLLDVEVCLSMGISSFGELCDIARTLRIDRHQAVLVAPAATPRLDTWRISPL